MQPSQFNYPEFVPDQVLTSSNLNDMFSYLDEQERLTRTNLIGVGIVCGLEVTTNTSGTQLTISQGCGITSGGYLITFPKTTFTQYNTYNALKPLYYEKFVDGVNKTQYYNLDELFETAVVEGAVGLTSAYLADKVVLLYVELLEDSSKNCDPGSCDDLGKNIDITFRPLLISINDAAKLKTQGANYGGTAFQTLPILKMPRFNVPATLLQSTTQIFQQYSNILTASFISNVQATLTQTYNMLLPLIQDIYPNNPFDQLSTNLAFLNDNTITSFEAINFQYYYDLFSDIEIAYCELRETGIEAFSLCCPDVNLFRLHLLLGNAIADANAVQIANRQYFIPSPVMECHCKQTQRVRWLFKRIQLMLQNFSVGIAASGNFGKLLEFELLRRRSENTTIRITPSKLGNYPLAKKAIPFYYLPAEGTDRLVDNWDTEKTAKGEASQNLSYNSDQYATDDFVLNPLSYDLEPYNFLRIEGHIGMDYTAALKSIINLRDRNRLPFGVVTLGSDLESLKTALSALGQTNTVAGLIAQYANQLKAPCQFQDLDALYDTFIAEITCQLCRVMLYFYNISEPPPDNAPDPVLSIVPLVLKCNPQYYVQPGTFGYSFEQFYTEYKAGDTIGFAFGAFEKMARFDTNINVYYFLLLYIENLYETFTASLGDFDYNAFLGAYKRLIRIATEIEGNLATQTEGDPSSLETLDQLKRLIGICVQKPMESLYRDYLLRWVYVMMLQKFGYFARKHSGIQHKAGVPMGGTFIMVYNEINATSTLPSKTLPAVNQFADTFVAERSAGAAPAAPAAAPATGNTVKDQLNMQTEKAKMVDPNQIAGNYNYTGPFTSGASITDINNLDIFKTASQTQIEDLAALLQNFNDSQSNLANVVPGIGNGIVIADFYLPYLCCSDCPPIQYTVTEVQQPLTIKITPSVFCSADSTPYDINVTPDGGDVTGEGSSKNAGGKYIFTPAAVKFDTPDTKQKDITLTYNAFGQSISTNITVYQKPTANFDVTPVEGSDTVNIVNNSSVYADKYLWDFGDGQTSSDKDPLTHTYGSDNTYTIALTVSNNICSSDPVTKTVTVITPDVTISIDSNAFCSNDTGTFPITATPDGSIVSGEGVVTDANNKFVFAPNQVQLNGAANKIVTLTNQKGIKSATTDVTVYQQPTADFTPIPQSTPGTIVFTNQSSAFATGYSWDFGDGSTSDQQNPDPHTYTADGNYQVSLTVSNSGSCSDTKTIPVPIQLPTAAIDIQPRSYCTSDDGNHPVTTGPEGGLVTGEGTFLDGANVYQFRPIIVDLQGLPSKKVTLTNTLGSSVATVDVTVYQMPVVNFTQKPGSGPLNIQFVNETVNADKYNWSFDTQGSSTDPNPNFTFSTPGAINVTLNASNGDVCKNSITKQVFVGQGFSPKTCLPFSDITLDSFNALLKGPNSNKEITALFLKAFPAYNSEMLAFFKDIGVAGSMSATDQVSLFGNLNAAALLTKWIRALTALLKQSNLITLITALVNILAELIEYIACIQPEDINAAKVSMQEPLTALRAFCKAFLTIVNNAKDNPALMQQLAQAIDQMNKLDAGLKTEAGRTSNAAKTNYLALLQAIILLFG
jgi:PKD repeat protein